MAGDCKSSNLGYDRFDPCNLHQIPKLMYYKDLETDKQAMRDYNQRMKENAASRRAKRTDGKSK